MQFFACLEVLAQGNYPKTYEAENGALSGVAGTGTIIVRSKFYSKLFIINSKRNLDYQVINILFYSIHNL